MKNLSNPQLLQRYRWLMVGTMLLDIIVTLMSQPGTYWQDRVSAFESNRLFHFFLVQQITWSSVLALFYILAAFIIVSILPVKGGLAAVFSFIICHYFRVSSWLDYHWQMGMTATFIYAFLIGELILVLGFAVSDHAPAQIVKNLRWMMIGVMVFDMVNTIAGQPASYWHDPKTADEGFPMSRFFIMQGLPIYLLYNMVWFTLLFRLVSSVPERIGFVLIFALILSYYFGASTWINKGWHVSAEGPILYGIVVSGIFVLLTFPGQKRI
jgi:hypothetical protein